jgi:hypothetical protein
VKETLRAVLLQLKGKYCPSAWVWMDKDITTGLNEKKKKKKKKIMMMMRRRRRRKNKKTVVTDTTNITDRTDNLLLRSLSGSDCSTFWKRRNGGKVERAGTVTVHRMFEHAADGRC